MVGPICEVLGTLLAVIIALFGLFYTYALWRYQYWKQRNVMFIPPKFPFGNIQQPFKQKDQIGVILKNCYDTFRQKGARYGGIFFFIRPIFVPVDPILIKNILIKDFEHFINRGTYTNEKDDPLAAHLFSLDGKRWRTLRNKLSPTFTSGKMKMMFETLLSCAPNMVKKVEQNISEPLDIKDLLECFTTDVIGSCAFGLECKSFDKSDSPFRFYGKKIVTVGRLERLKLMIASTSHYLGHLLGIVFTPKDAEQFFINLVKDTIDYRKKNDIQRNDFLQVVLNQNNLEFNDIAANCLLFFVAGFETSATTMSFALYYLAKHQDIQERLRSEIKECLKKSDNKITYETIFEMKYLGQVINETLRICPPITLLNRSCIKDYAVPDSDLVISKGTNLFIPVYGLHHDESIYPDPERFNPDRFEDVEKSSQIYLPFGDGPRNCIGLRFGLMQSKVGLVTLLSNYKFTLNSKTIDPLQVDPSSFVLRANGGIWLNAEKI